MPIPLRRLLTLTLVATAGLASLVGSGGGGGGDGGVAEDPNDITGWRTRDAKPLMTIVSGSGPAWPYDARLWQSSTRVVGVIASAAAIRLPNGREGLVVAAWGNSAEAAAVVPPMRLVIFEQGPDGLMREATASFVDDDITDGSGVIKIADFNGDGRDDFVLPMYTETPTTTTPPVPMPRSVAFVSQPNGRYARIDLNSDVNGPVVDAVQVAGAWQLFVPSGGPSLETGDFTWAGTFTWRWNGTGFTKVSMGGQGDPSAQASASAVVVRPFTGNGEMWMVRTDNDIGPGIPNGFEKVTRAWRIDANNQYRVPPVTLPAPYFNGKSEYTQYESWLDPQSKTHNATIWSTDLNQDGLPDLIAGAQIWGRTQNLQRAMLQLLVNKGGMNFEDQTDVLRPEFRIDGEIDMSPRWIDLDGSGIDTVLMGRGRWLGSGSGVLPRSRHGSYILVNDGTGRLYAAMDAEFATLGQQVADFINSQAGLGPIDSRSQPDFYPYRRADGKINFLAMALVHRTGVIDPGSQQFAFINVPLGIDITTGFKRDLTVPTRNGSRNIRTFAGNDTIHRALADPDCRIDGGLGTNTVVYPGRRADWVVSKNSDGTISVRPATGGGGTDTLKRVQKARFDDQTQDLTVL
jgi:hypothetical protein